MRLRLLARRNFGIGVFVFVLVGYSLFGTIYILPQYLGQAQGYNAEQIGAVLAWTGLPQLVVIPFVPWLMKRFDVRAIGFVGVSVFAASCFMNVALSADNAGDQFFIPNIVRALGQALVLTPISAITTAGIAPSEAGAASGLSNMLRNLGGAIGTATLATLITKREQFHSNVIGQSITLFSGETRRRIGALADYFQAHGTVDGAAAQHEAIATIGKIVHRQALIMAFGDAFAVVGVVLAIAAIALAVHGQDQARRRSGRRSLIGFARGFETCTRETDERALIMRTSSSARRSVLVGSASLPMTSRRLPQRTILSPLTWTKQAAKNSFFGGLAASGWHTAALTMRLIVTGDFKPAGGVVGAGNEISWTRPVRPGDELHVESEVLDVRPSKSQAKQGLVEVRTTTFNQRDEPVQVLVANLVVLRRAVSETGEAG